MNKKTKFMIAALSLATVTAGAVGLAGCGNNNTTDNRDQDIVAIYNSYVAYAEANGQTVLSYEQWLATVKGPQGEKGEDGATWLTGQGAPSATLGKAGDFYLNTTNFMVYSKGASGWEVVGEGSIKGSDGVSVTNVSYDKANGKLVVTLSSGDTVEVDLPKEITHIHVYDDEDIHIVLAPTPDNEGLGYIKCTDDGCEHMELVALAPKSYLITVTNADGEPVEGAKVVVNGAVATSNARGLAKVVGYGENNDYIIGVQNQGMTLAETYRTATGREQTIVINQEFARVPIESYGWVTEVDAIVDAGDYSVTLETFPEVDDGWWYEPASVDQKSIYVANTSDQVKKFRITPQSDIAVIQNQQNNPIALDNGSYNLILKPGENVHIYFTAAPDITFEYGQNITYSVKVRELTVPAQGSLEDYALNLVENTHTTVDMSKADDEGWVYFNWNNPDSEIPSVSFDLTNAVVELTTKVYHNWSTSEVRNSVVAGQSYGLYQGGTSYAGTYKLRVKAAGAGAVSFTLKTTTPVGASTSPKAITSLGTISEDETLLANYWLSFTVPTTGNYTVSYDSQNCNGIGISDSLVGNDGTLNVLPFVDGIGIVNLEAGKTYYIKVVTNMTTTGFEFNIRATDPALDTGLDWLMPSGISLPALEGDAGSRTASAKFNVKQGTSYYSVTAPCDGTFSIKNSSDGAGYFSWKVGDGNENSSISEPFAAGTVILIKIDAYDNAFWANPAPETVEYTLIWNEQEIVVTPEPVAKDHVFTLTDSEGNPVQGVTVTVKVTGGDVSGTTDADGKVTLSFLSGTYSYVISGLDYSKYYYAANSQRDETGVSTAYNITIYSRAEDYSFVADCDGVKLEGATVTVKVGSTVIGTQTTGADGVATIKMAIPDGVHFTYEIELSDDDKQNFVVSKDFYGDVTNESVSYTANIVATAKYSVVVYDDNGDRKENAAVTVVDSKGKVVATATTNYDGECLVALEPDEYSIKVSANGYVAFPVSVSGASSTVEINLTKIEVPDVGGDEDPDKPVTDVSTALGTTLANATGREVSGWGLIVGNTAIKNADGVSYYTFSAEISGTYTITLTNSADKAYVEYLSVLDSYRVETTLIQGGREVSVQHDLVLGAIRAVNKTYSFKLTLARGETLVIGFNTGVGEAGDGVVRVTTGAEGTVLAEGENQVDLSDGNETCYLDVNGEYDVTISWDDPNVTVVFDGNELTSGAVISAADYPDASIYTLLITSSSSDSVTLNVTYSAADTGMGGGYDYYFIVD